MSDEKLQKLLLIYIYTNLGESDVKMYNEVMTKSNTFEYDFKAHTIDENKQYLAKWKRENNIKITEYKFYLSRNGLHFNEYGCPVFIQRKGEKKWTTKN